MPHPSLSIQRNAALTQTPQISEALQELTPSQKSVAFEMLEFLQSDNQSDRFRCLTGWAGTGKTYLAQNVLKAYDLLLQSSEGKRANFLGVAPTHAAVQVLKESISTLGAECMTIYSALRMVVRRVKLDKDQKAELLHLRQIAELNTLNAEQNKRYTYLSDREHLAESQQSEVVPIGDPAALERVDVLLVDEVSMLPKHVVDYLRYVIYGRPDKGDEPINPFVKVILMGDPFQLPPVNERESTAFLAKQFTPLTQVIRNKGQILEYCSALRDHPRDIKTLHCKYAKDIEELSPQELLSIDTGTSDTNFILMPARDAYDHAVEELKRGLQVILIAGTNDRVDFINRYFRSKFVDESLGIQVGEQLITRRTVSRKKRFEEDKDFILPSEYQEGMETAFSDTPIIQTNTFASVKRINKQFEFQGLDPETKFKAFDCNIEILADSGDKTIVENVSIIDPRQYQIWRSECKEAWSMFKAFKSRSSKQTRGQMGKTASKVWKYLGWKNWDVDLKGCEIDQRRYRLGKDKIRNLAVGLSYRVDELSPRYCITAHKSQGQTLDIVVIDVADITSSYRGSASHGSEWDVHRLLYTAASRTRKQLIFTY